ncbi:MAG TPA: hypothetical protein PLZ36_16850 [Armatimonadota bacterium]|nr:hypothetical protein [Armatimonadota bacterium]
MKAITLSLLTIALALGVTAAWANDIASDQQARVQHAKEIVAGKRAALTGLHNTIADRKAPHREKARAVAAERATTAKETCRRKCDRLRDTAATPACPSPEQAGATHDARETPPAPSGEAGR